MDCCSSKKIEGTNRFFSRWSKKYARTFRKKGLDKIQQLLLGGVSLPEKSGPHILDIGCGVGSLHLTLLQKWQNATATGIEMSEGMIEHATKLSHELSAENRVQYILGDFVEQAFQVDQADITLLDKVVCCYEDLNKLIDLSVEKTRSIYALSHPRDTFLIRFSIKSLIFLRKLFGASFHPYWHDWEAMNERVIQNGFQPIHQASTFLWKAVVFKRT